MDKDKRIQELEAAYRASGEARWKADAKVIILEAKFVQVKELVDSVRAFAATEDRTMTKREHERLKRALVPFEDKAKAEYAEGGG